MANWLDKYEQGGMVLKQKTKDNYGKKANPNNPDVSLPPGFKGLAYNTKGRNYSPAWGGQFAMGGSLPGAVGFTYARTAGAAPSNGPYAKKTKASAQDGTNVKKPLVKLSADELKMERLKQYAQQQSRKEQPIVQSKGSMPDDFRKQLYEDAQNAELRKQLLKGADIATDIMQVGNFVPHPIGQAIGKAGNAAGAWVDAAQAAGDLYNGNYLSAAINAASVALPNALANNEFRRNSKYLQPGHPLYPLSPQAGILPGGYSRTQYIEPFTKVKGMTDKSLLANRALLGVLGAETAYDSYQNGGEMKYYQAGLDFKPKNISQDGSEIPVDPMGYWNPENVGNPVIIPSNEITMEGVDQPLIGISDTGDTQMMYPGEDYTFDGESVTEYPVAKGGISVNNADAQPIKKLDQSLNFTNYNKPTKGGWLDKYN